MDVCLLWVLCVVRYRSLRRIEHSSRGVLPTVVHRCVWSRNLSNEEAKAHYWAVTIQPHWVVTPGKQKKTKGCILIGVFLTSLHCTLTKLQFFKPATSNI